MPAAPSLSPEPWWRDFRSWCWSVVGHLWVLISTALLTVLGIVNGTVSRPATVDGSGHVDDHPYLPTWTLYGALGLLVLYACFRAWRDERHAHRAAQHDAALAARPLAPAAHLQDLRTVAHAIAAAIHRGDVAGHSDARTRALLAHLPELREPLETWDGAVKAVLDTRYAWRKKIRRVVEAAGLNQAPFVQEPLEVAIEIIGLQPALAGQADEDLILKLDTLQSLPEEGRTTYLTSGTHEKVIEAIVSEEERAAQVDRLQAVFRDCYRSAEAAAVPAAEERKAELMATLPPLFDDVEYQHHFDLIHVHRDCELCGKAPI